MCCNAVHTLKSNIAFVICDWLPNSACVWKKLFPEICFVIQFMCLLISFLQAASFCILYRADNRNVMVGKAFPEIHLVSPAVFPYRAVLPLSPNKFFLGSSCSEVVSTVSWVPFNEHRIPRFSLRMDLFFLSFLQKTTSVYRHCTSVYMAVSSTCSEFSKVILQA